MNIIHALEMKGLRAPEIYYIGNQVVVKYEFRSDRADALEREVARIAQAIRSLWSVENSLHWALDVVFDEDRSRKRVGNAAENYSRLMRVVMSLLKRDRQRPGYDKPLRRKHKLAGWKTEEQERILFGLPGEKA